MPKICYVPKRFSADSRGVIAQANAIIAAYQAQGFDLTLRQLYYQFVSRGLIPNRDSEYKRLGSIVNDARLAGLIDWERIQDRTRELRGNTHWNSPEEIVEAVARQYRIDTWSYQPVRPEVWIEKDALIGVIEAACNDLDVSFFSCRGYTSQSEMWVAAMRLLRRYQETGQTPVILHLGDHDPSGIDMSRDIEERLRLFLWHHEPDLGDALMFRRIALNADQVAQYNPPPNPAKLTDSRARGYLANHGDESWELDALEPTVIGALIRGSVEDVRDDDIAEDAEERQNAEKALLQAVYERWDDVAELVGEGKRDGSDS